MRPSYQLNIVKGLNPQNHGVNMLAISELLKLLVTVPVSYHHDIKAIAGSVDEKVAMLIEKPHQDMMSELSELTKESTASWDKRTPLLKYLLDNISALKLFMDSIEPLSEDGLSKLGTNLTGLVAHMHRIRNMSDSDTLTIQYADQEIKLHGLQKGLFSGYGTCRSGLILQNTLLAKDEFKINDTAEINKAITTALWEQQSHRIITKQAETIDSLKAEIVDLKHQLFMLSEVNIRKTEDTTPKMPLESPSFFKLLKEFFTEEDYPENPIHVNKGPCGKS